jgi:Pentapeptide repeats (8 copies)
MTAPPGATGSHDVLAASVPVGSRARIPLYQLDQSGGRHSARFEHPGTIKGTSLASREPTLNGTAARFRQIANGQQRLRLTQPARPVLQSRWGRTLAWVKRNLVKLFVRVDWTKVAAFLTAATAVAALIFTARSLDSTRDQYSLSLRGQLSDRFNKSIEALGSKVPDVQAGGIYSLESLTQDSPHDKNLRIVVFDLLGTYVRAHTDCSKAGAPPPDIQAALTVIGRRNNEAFNTFHEKIDLSNSCLNAADLRNALLENASLRWTTLTNTTFLEAHLASADLSRALLDNAYLGTDLTKAKLPYASLKGASFSGANLTGADLTRANLTGAKLTGANLTGANLTGADLTDICYDSPPRWPQDFTPPGPSPKCDLPGQS